MLARISPFFALSGFVDGRGYLKLFGISVAAFIASVILFPFILGGLVTISGCRGIGGACGALGVVIAMAYKPLATAVFLASLMAPALRRARDAGYPAAIGLIVPLLFAADYTFLTFAAAPWGFAFSAGVLSGSFPKFALIGMATGIALDLLPSGSSPRPPLSMPQMVAFLLGVFVALVAILFVSRDALPLYMLLSPLWKVVYQWGNGLAYVMGAFVASLVWLVWSERRRPIAPGSIRLSALHVAGSPGSGQAGLLGVPRWPVALFALVLTVVAFMTATWSQGASMLVAMPLHLTSVILPTFLLYFALLWAALAFFILRRPALIALMAFAVLPYGHWGYSHWVARQAHANEAHEIARIPTSPLIGMPSILVLESRSSTGLRSLRMFPGIERVVSKGAYTQKLMQFERLEKNKRGREPVAIDALPDRYLHLKVGRESSFAKARQVYMAAGGPFELRMIDGSGDDLIAVWYRAYNPSPSLAPLLTASGWFRGGNSATTDEVGEALRRFLEMAITSKRHDTQARLGHAKH